MSGLSANFAGAPASMSANLPGELIFGMPGESGGYYSIAVTQPNDTTMRLTFTPSQNTMAPIPAADIALPQGPKGDPGQADAQQVHALVEEYLAKNPPKVTENDPTVPQWAKAKDKPSYTAAEVGAVTAAELESAIAEAMLQSGGSGDATATAAEKIVEYTVDATAATATAFAFTVAEYPKLAEYNHLKGIFKRAANASVPWVQIALNSTAIYPEIMLAKAITGSLGMCIFEIIRNEKFYVGKLTNWHNVSLYPKGPTGTTEISSHQYYNYVSTLPIQVDNLSSVVVSSYQAFLDEGATIEIWGWND